MTFVHTLLLRSNSLLGHYDLLFLSVVCAFRTIIEEILKPMDVFFGKEIDVEVFPISRLSQEVTFT